MKHKQAGFGAIAGLLVIIVGWLVLRHTKTATPISTVSSPNLRKTVLVEVKDSGSTNLAGWDLQIFTNGGGTLTYSVPSREFTPTKTNKVFAAQTFAVSALRQSLAASHFGADAGNCMRSASFGSVETLVYNGKSTKDIDCYISANSQKPLGIQLNNIFKRAGLPIE